MGVEHWIVKKPSGEEWGLIKRLIIDPATRQITYADVVRGDTGRLVRVPWESFDVQNERIILSIPEGQLHAKVMRASGWGLPEIVTMEVWP
ncbi:MAG: hypothetical protein C4293_07585 [Nitrospiraceae bacterium]